jgi:hypothetical protein
MTRKPTGSGVFVDHAATKIVGHLRTFRRSGLETLAKMDSTLHCMTANFAFASAHCWLSWSLTLAPLPEISHTAS